MRVPLFVVMAFLTTSASAAPKTVARQLSGLLSIGNEAHFNRLNVDSDGNGELVDPESDKARPMPLGPVAVQGRNLSFTVSHSGRHVRCSGRIAGDSLVGSTGDCKLNFTATAALADPTSIFGAWRMDDGRVIAIGTMADFLQPTMFDYQSGTARYLYHHPDGRLTAGQGMVKPEPIQMTISRRGKLLEVRQGKKIERGRLLAFPERAVAWTNGTAKLAGTLIMPLGHGPFPAVVLTQMF